MKTFIANGLPRICWNAIAVGGIFLSLALAIKIVRSSDVKLAIASNRLEVTNQALKVNDVLSQLEFTTYQLQQQQEQYIKLKTNYDKLLAQTQGTALKELKPVIEQIETIPLDQTLIEIEQNKQQLQEMINDQDNR